MKFNPYTTSSCTLPLLLFIPYFSQIVTEAGQGSTEGPLSPHPNLELLMDSLLSMNFLFPTDLEDSPQSGSTFLCGDDIFSGRAL